MLPLAFIIGALACHPAPPPTCVQRTDPMDRDQCMMQEIATLPADQADAVLERARMISDPMIRGAAVSAWIAENSNSVARDKGEQLCLLLEGRDRSYCQRRLSSPHLQR